MLPAKAGEIILPPKPAIVKVENIEFSKHMLLGMPITMGMFNRPAGGIVYSAEFLNGGATTESSSTMTRTGVDFGAEDTNRLIVVACSHYRGDQSDRTFSSASIGGVTATLNVQGTRDGSSSNNFVCICSAVVPTGTSGTITVTLNSSVVEGYFSVYRLVGFSATAFATAGANGGTSATLSTTTDGCSVGVFGTSSDTTSTTWTGLTEQNDLDNGNARHSSAFSYPTSSGSTSTRASGGTAGALWRAAHFQRIA